MKTNSHGRQLFFLWVVFCLFALPLTSLADSSILLPDRWQEDSPRYEQYVPGANLSLLLPLGVQSMLHHYDDGKSVTLRIPEFPGLAFSFFSIDYPGAENVDLEALEGADMNAFVRTVSLIPSKTTQHLQKDFLPGVDVLRVFEATENMYAEHLLATHGNYVLNMVVASADPDERFSPEMIAIQEQVLSDALSGADMTARYAAYPLTELGISLALPKDLYIRVQLDSASKKALIVTSANSSFVVNVLLERKDEYAGQSVETLDKAVLDSAMEEYTFQGYNTDSLQIIEDYAGGIPVLSYDSDRGPVMVKHLLALRDGWAVYVSCESITEMIAPEQTEWANEVWHALMRQMLTGEGEIPGFQEHRESTHPSPMLYSWNRRGL